MSDPAVNSAALPQPPISDWRQYASKVRHDLRTPMNALIGYTEMLLEEAQDLQLPAAIRILQCILETNETILPAIADFSARLEASAGAKYPQADCARITGARDEVLLSIGALRNELPFATLFSRDIDELTAACGKLGEVLGKVESSDKRSVRHGEE